MHSTNTYTPGFQDQPCNFERGYSPQVDESVHETKKLRRELEETNHLLRFICYTLLQSSGERGGTLGINTTAMLLGLETQKRKRKKHIDTGLERWSW